MHRVVASFLVVLIGVALAGVAPSAQTGGAPTIEQIMSAPFATGLVEQLRKRKVHVEQIVFPDEIHGFLLHQRWLRTFSAAADFFDRHLRARPATASGQ